MAKRYVVYTKQDEPEYLVEKFFSGFSLTRNTLDATKYKTKEEALAKIDRQNLFSSHVFAVMEVNFS